MLSLGDLRSGCYNILKEVEGDSNAYSPVLFKDFINNYYFNILTNGIVNIFTGETIEKLSISFTEKSRIYKTYNQTTLSEECSTGDTTIYATTTGYPNSGVLYLNGEIVTYTSKTDDSFILSSGINSDFKGGDVIRYVYVLPSDYASTINILLTNYNKPLDLQDYREINNNINSLFGTIIQGKYLVLFNYNTSGDSIELKYNLKPTLLEEDTDEIIIPDDIYGNCIKYLAVGEMMYNRGEENRGKEVFLYGIARLRELYNYYNEQGGKSINRTSFKKTYNGFNL